jgi:hypothetical protein
MLNSIGLRGSPCLTQRKVPQGSCLFVSYFDGNWAPVLRIGWVAPFRNENSSCVSPYSGLHTSQQQNVEEDGQRQVIRGFDGGNRDPIKAGSRMAPAGLGVAHLVLGDGLETLTPFDDLCFERSVIGR